MLRTWRTFIPKGRLQTNHELIVVGRKIEVILLQATNDIVVILAELILFRLIHHKLICGKVYVGQLVARMDRLIRLNLLMGFEYAIDGLRHLHYYCRSV